MKNKMRLLDRLAYDENFDWQDTGLMMDIPANKQNVLIDYLKQCQQIIRYSYENHIYFYELLQTIYPLIKRIYIRTCYYDELNMSDVVSKYVAFFDKNMVKTNELYNEKYLELFAIFAETYNP